MRQQTCALVLLLVLGCGGKPAAPEPAAGIAGAHQGGAELPAAAPGDKLGARQEGGKALPPLVDGRVWEEHLENPVDAQAKYRGKRVRVFALVTRIDSNGSIFLPSIGSGGVTDKWGCECALSSTDPGREFLKAQQSYARVEGIVKEWHEDNKILALTDAHLIEIKEQADKKQQTLKTVWSAKQK